MNILDELKKLDETQKVIRKVEYVRKEEIINLIQKILIEVPSELGTTPIKSWQRAIHAYAIDHGFWEHGESPYIPEKLCLIHSEISEALEAYRNHIPVGEKGWIGEELADATIRIFDLAEKLGLNLETIMKKKHAVNINREYKHGGKEC